MELITKADPKPAFVVVDAWLDTVPGDLKIGDPQQSRTALHPWRDAGRHTQARRLVTHTPSRDTARTSKEFIMALYTAGAGAILTPEQVHQLVVRPVLDQAVSAQVTHRGSDRIARLADPDRDRPTAVLRLWPKAVKFRLRTAHVTEQVVTPKKLAALSVISSELAADSHPPRCRLSAME